LGPLAKVETYARLEGRNMTMVLAPEKKAPVKKNDLKADSKPDTEPAAVEAAPAAEADATEPA
jgi:hypothetical protein